MSILKVQNTLYITLVNRADCRKTHRHCLNMQYMDIINQVILQGWMKSCAIHIPFTYPSMYVYPDQKTDYRTHCVRCDCYEYTMWPHL